MIPLQRSTLLYMPATSQALAICAPLVWRVLLRELRPFTRHAAVWLYLYGLTYRAWERSYQPMILVDALIDIG